MNCQKCDKPATIHVTEIVDDKPVDYHVCAEHFKDLGDMEPVSRAMHNPAKGPAAFWGDDNLRKALADPVAREKGAAYLLPALCLALLDEQPEVRVAAAYRLMWLGSDARSTLGALRDAVQDPDERVRKAAEIAAEFIQARPDSPSVSMPMV
jgi:hypothetical protein